MASKKKAVKNISGFKIFMNETYKKLTNQGKRINYSDMPIYCKSDWEEMSDQKKNEYKAKAKEMKNGGTVEKLTTIGEKVLEVEQQFDENRFQTDVMYSYIEELVQMSPKNYLHMQKFILIHINPYVCENEGFYFPAEISMVEFSLDKGLIRTFHQFVGFDKQIIKAPLASMADINLHAKNNHLIDGGLRFPNNYKDILLKMIGFIIDADVGEDVLSDPALDMPPIYTAHDTTGNELTVVISSLYRLYSSAENYVDKTDFNGLFKIYHLDKLFMELKNAAFTLKNPESVDKAIPSVAMATENLSKNYYSTIKSVGCSFHEKREHSHVCSNYYVCKWIYIISVHCCNFFNIKPVPGCHYQFDLSKTNTTIEESLTNTHISDDEFTFTEKKPTKLSDQSFPALDGKSSIAIQQPLWNRPDNKVPAHIATSCKSTNFPPLGNSKQVIPENTQTTPISEVNAWHKGRNNQVKKCDAQSGRNFK